MRGRVFSAFYVMRDIIFLFGMAGAGLADILDIRLMLVVSSLLLFVSASFTLVAPGLGIASLRAARAAAREAPIRRRPSPVPRSDRPRWPTSIAWSGGSRPSPG